MVMSCLPGFDSAHLVATNDLIKHDWIIDLGASFHVTPNREQFTTYDVAQRGQVWLDNGYAYKIVGVGDVQIKFQNGSTFTLKNISKDYKEFD